MNKIALPALACVFALAACTPAAAPPQSAGDTPAPYSALGTEPGWTLDITPSRLAYTGDYGETKISVANPGARPSVNGERYVTNRLTIDITHGECNDGMSDRRYRDTVTLTADGKTVKGCGGGVLPPPTLAGTNWTFVSIGGIAVAPDQPTSLTFDGERLSGSAGCNRIMGSYASDGKTLTAGPLAATRMACHGPAMTQEQAVLALLTKPVSLRFTADGQMVLTGEGGASALLAPVI